MFKHNNNLKNSFQWYGESGAGFTMIELLVVIAVIAVLATIVLVNVSNYINNSKDAAIKSDLLTLQTNGTLYYVNNGNYTDFCTNNMVTGKPIYDTVNKVSPPGEPPICNSTATAWCTCATLYKQFSFGNPFWFCVDSTGHKGQEYNQACSAGECTSVGVCTY